MGKVEYGKNVLKFIGVIYSIFAVLLFILLVVAFSGLVPEISDIILIDYSYTTPSIYHSISLIVLLMTVFEIFLLFKASNNPKKTFVLMIITTASLITSLLSTVTQGFTAFEFSNVVWSVVILIGLLFAKSINK